MPEALILTPMLLAAVLVASGVAKLRDPGSGRAAFDALRVPPALAQPWIVAAVPYAELALAVGLLLTQGWVLLGVTLATVGLFAAYWILIARAVAAGGEVSCNCFGAAASGRVSRWTLLRNSLLLLVAVLAVVDATMIRDVVLARIGALDAEAAWWLVGAVVSAAVVGLVLHEPAGRTPAAVAPAAGNASDAQASQAPATPDEPYERRPIPDVTLVDGTGERVSLRDLPRDRAVFLIWLSFTCAACADVFEQLPGWAARVPHLEFRPVVGHLPQLADRVPALAASGLEDPGAYVQAVLGQTAVPMGVLLGTDGLLAGGPFLGLSELAEVVDELAERFAEAGVPAEPRALTA
nr:hypothetical protein [Propionibacterium sp.]